MKSTSETRRYRASAGRRLLSQRFGFAVLALMALATVVPIVLVVIHVVIQGAPAISWEFLSGVPREGMRQGGILPAIVGTFYLTLGTAVFSVGRVVAGSGARSV